MPNRSAKSTRRSLENKLTELVEAEQDGLTVLEKFERADRLKARAPNRRPDEIIGDTRRQNG